VVVILGNVRSLFLRPELVQMCRREKRSRADGWKSRLVKAQRGPMKTRRWVYLNERRVILWDLAGKKWWCKQDGSVACFFALAAMQSERAGSCRALTEASFTELSFVTSSRLALEPALTHSRASTTINHTPKHQHHCQQSRPRLSRLS
jgi:hypothetical protein